MAVGARRRGQRLGDETLAIVERYRERVPACRSRTRWTAAARRSALNVGVRAARGAAVLFCDADDEVAPGWLAAMGDALLEHEFVASRGDATRLNAPWLQETREAQPPDELSRVAFPPYFAYAGSGGIGVRKDVHERFGGFDESMDALFDVDYCIRLQLGGIELRLVPHAVMHYRYRERPRAIFDQARRYSEAAALLQKRYGQPATTPLKWPFEHWKAVAKALPSAHPLGPREGRLAPRLAARALPRERASPGAGGMTTLPALSPEPLVSIVTPSYNTGRYIEETLRSVAEQDYPRIEHIVLDSGSTDETPSILARYPSVSVVEDPRGVTEKVNRGFELTQGEIVAWINADDVYLPGAFRKAVAAFLDEPEVALVYCNYLDIDENSVEIGRRPSRQCTAAELVDEVEVGSAPDGVLPAGRPVRRRAAGSPLRARPGLGALGQAREAVPDPLCRRLLGGVQNQPRPAVRREEVRLLARGAGDDALARRSVLLAAHAAALRRQGHARGGDAPTRSATDVCREAPRLRVL